MKGCLKENLLELDIIMFIDNFHHVQVPPSELGNRQTIKVCSHLYMKKQTEMGSNYAKEKWAILLQRGKRRQVWTDL